MNLRRRILSSFAVAGAVALAAAFVYFRTIPGHTRPHESIGPQAQTVRAAFNADVHDVRVVALVSPTCGACLRGASELQSGVFSPITSNHLRGFIVWVPKLGAHESDVAQATHTVSDSRARQFWDPGGYLVHAYEHTLHLGQDAWDVYMIYPPGTRWLGPHPPAPAYWMTQLSNTQASTLNPSEFADHTKLLLRGA
jgi:hypothetical protein